VRASSTGWRRYFYSSGRTRYTLGDPFTPGQINSQLTYKNLASHAGEVFARLDHASAVFVKSFVGAGSLQGGINDEDFPPAVAGNPFVCTPTISGSVLSLSKTETWAPLRAGLNGVINLVPQWKLTLDGAYLPVVHLSGFDNHWLRPDINPLPQSGDGWGYQLEGIVSYDVTQNLSVGAGGRYWYAKTSNGITQFPGVPASPTTFSYERYGGFIHASCKFGEPDPVAAGH
jgi:hypothetical protein